MHILLINSNPVVSRLLALCTRKEEMILEEVTNISALKRKVYDIIFVDEESNYKEVLALDNDVNASKKILFSNEDIDVSGFDMTIKKPFLPSQIIEILENVQNGVSSTKAAPAIIEEEEEEKETHSFIFPLSSEETVEDTETKSEDQVQVLDVNEIEKIKALLDMDEETESVALSEDEIEAKKIEVIKEQLIAEGLEIVEEDEIVESLSTQESIQIFDINQEESPIPVKKKKEKRKSKKSKKKKSDKKKTFDFTEEEREHIEDAIAVAIGTLKRKKMKKLLKGKKVKIKIQLEKDK